LLQRLAHAHEDEIAQARFIAGLERALRVQDLGDDFAGTQVPGETHLPRRTEDATHRATTCVLTQAV